MNIQTVKAVNLRLAPWRATYILRPDLRLLRDSLRDHGWIAPLIIRSIDSTIIDGNSRWLVAQDEPKLGIEIPTIWYDVDIADSMIMHIRLNRGRGNLVAKDLSHLIQNLLRTKKYDAEDIRVILKMSADEFDVLASGDLVKRRKMAAHTYSKAWVPVETSGAAEVANIEKPPTPDG